MSKIAEALARALAGVVTKTEDLWVVVRRQYEDILDTLVDTSRKILRITTIPALIAIWLGGLTKVPPILIALVYATATLIVWMFSINHYMREIWNIQIGDWTVKALVDALKGVGASWPTAVREAVISIRLAIRNVFATGFIPVLAALWILAADPYWQWLALLGVTLAALIGILGFLTPSERGGRGLLLLAAFALLVGSAWWSATTNPNSWYNQYQRGQEAQALAEEVANQLPPCSQNPEVRIVPDNDPGITEYEIGRIEAGCVTGIISPPPGTWENAGFSPRDRGSWASIAIEGMPTQHMSCGGGDRFYFPDTWPTFRLEGGSGYLTFWTWDDGHPGPPGDHICF